jgi:RNA recognition motif-containing protein
MGNTQLEPDILENIPQNAKNLVHMTEKVSKEHQEEISRTIFVQNLPSDVN